MPDSANEPAAPVLTGDPDVVRRLGAALGLKYEVTRLLGRGGFAEVYEVYDSDLQRRLAVKVLRPDIGWTGGMLARFKQEARAIARLNHPHTVPIHFVGEGEGLVFYAMPFVEARSLSEVLRSDGPLTPEAAVTLAVPVLDALEHAHQHGLVHRDIKPANIVVETATGRPLLVDFGIAKSLDDQSPHHTQTGFVVGTPLYMSPEQALGQSNVDARADVYSIGAVLYQMLTGSPPFEGSTSQEIVGKHLTEPVPVPTRSDVRIPAWLSDVIIRCMAKQPAKRFQSAAAVRDALLAGEAGREPGASSSVTAARMVRHLEAEDPTLPMVRASPPAGTRVRARRWAALALVAALVLAVAGGSWVARPGASLVIENRLLEPVSFTIGRRESIVRSQDSIRIPLPRGSALHAEWRLIRTRSGSGHELGVPLGGSVQDDQPHGALRHRLDLAELGRPFVAPVVTNMTDAPLRVTLRDQRDLPLDCDCTVPAGVTVAIGYYDPSRLSALEFTTPSGARARVAVAAARADTIGGALPVVLATSDFTVPAANPARAAAPSHGTAATPRSAPDSSMRTQVIPMPIPTDSQVPPPPSPQRKVPSAVRTDPLRGTVTNQ